MSIIKTPHGLITELSTQQVRLAASGEVNRAGQFEIEAISAGEGNGWLFSEQVLQASLSLWEGVGCYVDHGGWFGARSVRDLGGVCRKPRWSPSSQGIHLELVTMGPSARLVEELGRQILAESPPAAAQVGFSADIVFTARGKQVEQILRVNELCLVINPARGGTFIRAMNNLSALPAQAGSQAGISTFQGGITMEENSLTVNESGWQPPTPVPLASPPEKPTDINHEGEQLREQAHLSAVQQAEAVGEMRLQVCQLMLETSLASANLPAPLAEHVRAQFTGKIFTGNELSTAIEQARRLISDLTGAAVVTGPAPRLSASQAGPLGAGVQSLFSSEDQLQAAVDDLLGAPRTPGAENLRVARLAGIKELYMLLTGDRDLYGGYYADRVHLATTANFAGLVKNALNKVIANQWAQLGAVGYDWWMRVTHQEHFDTLNQVTGILVGTVGNLPSVAEGAEYTELKIGDSPETASFTKYGGYIPLTLELIDRDDTRKLRQYPLELAKAGIRRISSLVAAVFTDNSGIGPTLADGGALFNTTATSTAGGHANLLTTALSSSAWEAVKQAIYKQPLLIANESGYYGSGPRQGIRPRYLIVPVELELTAKKILYGEWENNANIHADNLQRQMMGDVVVVPEWTDASDWAACADPNLMPGIIVGERFGLRPEIFVAGDELSPAVFMNDEHRIKVRHFIAVLVQDFRALHKNNVA